MQELAGGALARVSALADELTARIGAQSGVYSRAGMVPAADLWQSCHDNLTRVLELVVQPGPGVCEGDHFDAARATGRRRAEQHLPLDDVLRSFRIGGRLVWEALIEQARGRPGGDPDALLDVGTRVWEVVDAVSAQVATAYHDAERQLVRADEQHRASAWEGLLSGRAGDPAFAADAASVLAIPAAGPYLVVAAEPGPDGTGVGAVATRLRAAGVQSAWQARSQLQIGLLALRSQEAGTALRVLRGALPGPAGVSLVAASLAEVGVAYQQALLARRARRADGVAVTALADRLPEALLLSAPELTAALVQRWLGPLVDLAPAEGALLLDTLEAWLCTGGSVVRTAQAVHCHRNTVVNRLHRIEALTSWSSAADVPLELSLAVRAWRLLLATPLS